GTGYEDSINRLTIPLTEQFNLKGRTVDDSVCKKKNKKND
ncbi:unnamed protein product, partial [Brassica oleracea]